MWCGGYVVSNLAAGLEFDFDSQFLQISFLSHNRDEDKRENEKRQNGWLPLPP
jgi:hypothetical protein